jgi:hypothetical protein
MLCQTCKVCFFQGNLASRAALQWEPHQRSLEDLEHAAQEACYVCHILWNSLSYAYQLQMRNQALPFVPTLNRICDNAELSPSLTNESHVIDIICQVAEGRDVASRKFLILPSKGLAHW